jgi:hypothetical protein
MPKYQCIALLLLSFAQDSIAQSSVDAPSHKQPVILISTGLVPNTRYNAFKMSLAANNLFFQRYGLYTSIETSTTTTYFTNIYGVTGTINKYFYGFAGVDIFTKYGLLTKGGGIRKELGLGFIPFDFALVKVGWSLDVGLTLEAGVRFDLQPIPGR